MNIGRIAVLFPPQFEPFQPYLAGPYLKGLLQQHGFRTRVVDLNIAFYDWMLDQTQGAHSLQSRARKAADNLKRAPRDILAYRRDINTLEEYLSSAASPAECGLTRFRVPDAYRPDGVSSAVGDDQSIPCRFATEITESRPGWLDNEAFLVSAVVIDQLPFAAALARVIRSHNPAAQIFLGGPYITKDVVQSLQTHSLGCLFDHILSGEAERSLLPLLGAEPDLVAHTSPDFADLDLDRYWSSEIVLPYLLAHGCKWGRCTFCSHHLSYSAYRPSALQNVVTDLRELKGRHGARCISFCDEYIPAAVLKELIEKWQLADLNLRWSTFVRPEPAFRDAGFTKALYDAGARMLMYGFESFSTATLKAMRKGTNPANYLPILQSTSSANIASRLDIMFGFPGETDAEALETYSALTTNQPLLDTPFSSIAVSAFEMRTGTPVMEALDDRAIAGGTGLRGALDFQVAYEPLVQKQSDGGAWRDRAIGLFKEHFDSDFVTPANKTHQLLFKTLFDEGAFPLPLVPQPAIVQDRVRVALADGASATITNDGLQLNSVTNGGAVVVSDPLGQLVHSALQDSALTPHTLREGGEDLVSLLVFLARNDYLALTAPAPTSERLIDALAHA